ncbi:MAG: hypothetical protein D8M58_03925 [Calditrichaeota bacterium]|nr:MAG: hypothetical protein DWQ03_03150 [Calditrichota bacterium]MBL1204516.1 hypothetical protein [Calditrichota bacterium]
MINSFNFGNSGKTSSYLLLSGILLILFGITIIVTPEILVFMIATPIIFIGIFLIAKWFKSHRNRNNQTWVEI